MLFKLVVLQMLLFELLPLRFGYRSTITGFILVDASVLTVISKPYVASLKQLRKSGYFKFDRLLRHLSRENLYNLTLLTVICRSFRMSRKTVNRHIYEFLIKLIRTQPHGRFKLNRKGTTSSVRIVGLGW